MVAMQLFTSNWVAPGASEMLRPELGALEDVQTDRAQNASDIVAWSRDQLAKGSDNILALNRARESVAAWQAHSTIGAREPHFFRDRPDLGRGKSPEDGISPRRVVDLRGLLVLSAATESSFSKHGVAFGWRSSCAFGLTEPTWART